jgi:dienelactone hydrolase
MIEEIFGVHEYVKGVCRRLAHVDDRAVPEVDRLRERPAAPAAG